MEIYTDVIVQLLYDLDNEDEEFIMREEIGKLIQQDTSENVWPPWPWPPWDGDDDDDKLPKPKPGPRKPDTPDVQAKKVVEFEKKIADASLDT